MLLSFPIADTHRVVIKVGQDDYFALSTVGMEVHRYRAWKSPV